MLTWVKRFDALILILVSLGVGCFLGSGFMLAGKRSHESRPPESPTLSVLALDIAGTKRDIETMRERHTKGVRSLHDCLWALILRLDRLEKQAGVRPKTPPGIPYTVDLPSASFGPEPERIAPQEIPFPVDE